MRVLWGLTGVLVLAPLAGQFSPGIALLQMMLCPVTFAALIGSVVIGVQPGQRRALVALPFIVLGWLLSAHLTLGVPFYVRRDAQVIIDAAEAWRAAHGEYPAALDVAKLDPNCFSYRASEGGFHLTCRGVFFTKCSYDHPAKAWYGWD